MNFRSLTEIKPVALAEIAVFDQMLDKSDRTSKDAGKALLGMAREYGLTLREYLDLAVKAEGEVTGFELSLAKLNIPLRNSFHEGIVLQAASETFQTFPGTRAMFPEVVDAVLRWKNRQEQFESIAPILAGSRSIRGNEMISTFVSDDSGDRDTYTIAEGARIPVRSIRMTESAVKIHKHGSGIRMTYEFSRRSSLDVITPYLARVERELERSKVSFATYLLVNGDGVAAAATEVDQSSLNDAVVGNSTNGLLSWKHFLKWLVNMAKAGTPVDTLLMNWDAWFQYNLLFGTPVVLANATNTTQAEALQKAGVTLTQSAASLLLKVKPAISSSVSANKMIGFAQADTLEELIEANSQIEEADRAIENQTISIYRTENSGCRLLYPDTRSVFDFGN